MNGQEQLEWRDTGVKAGILGNTPVFEAVAGDMTFRRVGTDGLWSYRVGESRTWHSWPPPARRGVAEAWATHDLNMYRDGTSKWATHGRWRKGEIPCIPDLNVNGAKRWWKDWGKDPVTGMEGPRPFQNREERDTFLALARVQLREGRDLANERPGQFGLDAEITRLESELPPELCRMVRDSITISVDDGDDDP